MSKFEETLISFDTICKQNSISYAIIGGFALIIHGMQRLTQDIDITIAVEIESIPEVGNIFLKHFTPRKPEPIDFFKKYFVLPLIDSNTSIPIDISAGVGGFDRKVIERAIQIDIYGIKYPICSFEDLVIYKLVANRPQDHVDLKFLFSLKKDYDVEYLYKIAKCFKDLERSDIIEKLNELLKNKK